MDVAYAAMRSGLLVIEDSDREPRVAERFADTRLECVHAHPDTPETAFVGTYRDGLYRTTDGGTNWDRVGEATFDQSAVMAIATNPADPRELWVGTEPSRLYRSTDAGATWQRRPGLTDLESSSEWSFPPRPHTHHVRWIEVDPHDPSHLYIGIEAGALVQTHDRGATFEDRVPSANLDNHTLATHPDAVDRAYSAAGDGYAETRDDGRTWNRRMDGLDHRYVWGLAVDPGDPDTVLVSAAAGARTAHTYESADAHLYRRQNGVWESLDHTDVPTGSGALRSVLTRGQDPGNVYALNNHGLYATGDAGGSWRRISTPWPDRFDSETAQGLAVV